MPNLLFLFQYSMLHFTVISSWTSLYCSSFSDFPCFSWSGSHLRITKQVLCEMCCSFDLSDSFLMIRLSYGFARRGSQKYCLNHITSRACMINRTYHYNVVLAHLAEVEPFFQNFCYFPSTLLFHTVLFGRNSLCTAHS